MFQKMNKSPNVNSAPNFVEYSEVKRQIIGARNELFFWAIGMFIVAIALLPVAVFSESQTFVGFVLFLRFATFVWLCICVYKLSMSVEPKRSLAIFMVVLSFTLIGFLFVISLARKAWKISHEVLKIGTTEPFPTSL